MHPEDKLLQPISEGPEGAEPDYSASSTSNPRAPLPQRQQRQQQHWGAPHHRELSVEEEQYTQVHATVWSQSQDYKNFT